MRKPWIAAALVLGIGMLALAAQQAQQVQKPPVAKKIEKPDGWKTPIGFITITNPKSGDRPWFAGFIPNSILWTKAGPQPADVKIELRDAGCTGGVLVIAENTPNDGGFTWTVPESVPDGSYTIRISGPGVSKCSDPLQIRAKPWKVTVPASTWKIGSTQTVTWTTTQPASQTVRLYLTDSMVNQQIISPVVPNVGSATITVPTPTEMKYHHYILLVAEYQSYGYLEIREAG